jgi:regulatory protein
LARREYSRSELREKLTHKGYPESEADALVTALVREGFVSDQRFCDSLIRARRERGYGPRYIERELKQKGVPETMIAEAMLIEPHEWQDQLRRVYQKKYRDGPPNTMQERARRARFLYGRGYTAEQIMQMLDEPLSESQ